IAGYIGAALRAGDAGVAVVTAPHRTGLEERLRASGFDLDAASAGGQYLVLDAVETLAQFMVADRPDAARFAEVVGGIVARAAAGGRAVRVFGEMVALLALAGDYAAAVRVEEFWNALQQTRPFTLFCAYPMAHHGDASLARVLGDVIAAHTRVIP